MPLVRTDAPFMISEPPLLVVKLAKAVFAPMVEPIVVAPVELTVNA